MARSSTSITSERARALGRLGGLKGGRVRAAAPDFAQMAVAGGRARMAKLSAKERAALGASGARAGHARRALRQRWFGPVVV